MVLLRKALILGYPAAPSSARSSADQSIGLRSQGSWVRIPPGAPVSGAGLRVASLSQFHRIGEVEMKTFSLALVAAAFALAGSAAAQQQYPARNVNMLVP